MFTFFVGTVRKIKRKLSPISDGDFNTIVRELDKSLENMTLTVIPKGHKVWDKPDAPLADTELVEIKQDGAFHPWLRVSGKKLLQLQGSTMRDIAKTYATYIDDCVKNKREIEDSQRVTADQDLPACKFASMDDALKAFRKIGYSKSKALDLVEDLVRQGRVPLG